MRPAPVSVELAALNVPNSFNINYYSSFENVIIYYNNTIYVCKIYTIYEKQRVYAVLPKKTASAVTVYIVFLYAVFIIYNIIVLHPKIYSISVRSRYHVVRLGYHRVTYIYIHCSYICIYYIR